MLDSLFSKVTYTCDHCGARQRIPFRRVHRFERFHGLGHGEVALIVCPTCGERLQVPTHTGTDVCFDPDNPDNAVIHPG